MRAGKLLARKRPHLIPIVDRVVKRTLRAGSDDYWLSIRSALSDESRRNEIEGLRPPGLTPKVTTLRLLDAAIWMTGSRSTAVKKVWRDLELNLRDRPF